jgi:hypothetical protein
LGEGIQVCSIKGASPLQKGDHLKNVKVAWGHHTFSSQELLNTKSPGLRESYLT